MTNVYTNGIGATTGHALALSANLYTSADIYYVDSQTGDASYSGKDRKLPLDTVSAAITAIGANDDRIIVCLDGHVEEVATTMTLTRRVTIVGEGSNAGVPTVAFTVGHASNDIFACSTGNCRFFNLWFRPPGNAATPAASTASAINVGTQDGIVVEGCYFDSDQYSDDAMLKFGLAADNCRVTSCRFKSVETATTAGLKPLPGMSVSSAVTGLTLNYTIFDGGTVGYDDGSGNNWALDNSGAAISELSAINISILNGADVKLNASTTGHISVATATGSSSVIW